MKRGIFIVAAIVTYSGAAWAQDESWSKFTINVGVGVANPVRDTGSRLDTGYGFTAGAGMNFTSHLGLLGEFTYNSFGVNQATLQALEFPNGEMRLWAFTANPVVRLNRSGKVDFYLIGGGGVYHRVTEFSQPTVATYNVYDPFFGIVYPVGVPANEVLSSYSTTAGGLNIGGGITFKMGRGNAKAFVESRYHHMFSNPATTILPVTFGIRW
jgi:opacity protein-like surface antigen